MGSTTGARLLAPPTHSAGLTPFIQMQKSDTYQDKYIKKARRLASRKHVEAAPGLAAVSALKLPGFSSSWTSNARLGSCSINQAYPRFLSAS